MSIDHEAAKNVCNARLAQDMHPSSSDRNIALAYLDLSAQLAAERARVDMLVTLQNMVLEGLRDRSEYQWAYAIEKQIKAILEGRDHA